MDSDATSPRRARLATRRRRISALIGVSLAGSLLASPPALAERTVPARAFVESIGVNVHMSYDDTAYSRLDLVKRRLAELGVRHVRDGIVVNRPDQYRALNSLAEQGIRLNLIMGDPQGRWGTGTLHEQLDTLREELRGVESVEGPNEYDISGDSRWEATLRSYQERLYEAINGDPSLARLAVLGPSLVHDASYSALGRLGPWLDRGNLHPYPGGNPPGRDLARQQKLAAQVSGRAPLQATETGYHDAVDSKGGHLPASEHAASVYMPRLYLEHFRQGFRRTYAYELVDEKPDPSGTDAEQHFGLLRHDFSRKPAYRAVRNLIAILDDRGGFRPGSLDLSLQGPTDLRHLLLQKSDGSYYLVLWRDVSVWDPDARKPSPVSAQKVTVDAGRRMSRVSLYSPARGTRPYLRRSDVRTMSVPVGARVAIVEMTP